MEAKVKKDLQSILSLSDIVGNYQKLGVWCTIPTEGFVACAQQEIRWMTIIVLFEFTNYKTVKSIGLLSPISSQGKVSTVLGITLLKDNPMTTHQHCASLPVSPPQHQYCSTEAEIGQKLPPRPAWARWEGGEPSFSEPRYLGAF